MAPKRTNPADKETPHAKKCFADLSFATIQMILDYAEPDLAGFEITKHFDMNTLCLMMCFMMGYHPMQEVPQILG